MVLGIENRTENWQTARCFSPLFGKRVIFLARRLGEPPETQPRDVHLELYWKGMRDHCLGTDKKRYNERIAECYRRLFPNLYKDVEEYGKFRKPQNHHYKVSDTTQEAMLASNLCNSEIDVVVESPRNLFIGEAKYKSSFHANGNLVVVHQLIRQYVMARILVDLVGYEKKVVPFVVGGSRRQEKVGFMLHKG